MFVKICGLRTREMVESAVAAGADALGFVFVPSPRQVTPAVARGLCAGLPSDIVRVAVMRRPQQTLVQRVLDEFQPDWLQTDAEDLADLDLPDGCIALPVYRNGRILPNQRLPARLLFEGDASGSGQRADWSEAAVIARRTELMLAGGLGPSNVVEAIRQVGPWGVDVSSGVERRRGEKDGALIKSFIGRVRAMENAA